MRDIGGMFTDFAFYYFRLSSNELPEFLLSLLEVLLSESHLRKLATVVYIYNNKCEYKDRDDNSKYALNDHFRSIYSMQHPRVLKYSYKSLFTTIILLTPID